MKDITPQSSWAEVEEYACEVFGREFALRWTNKPLKRFSDRSMKQAFHSDQQAQVVELLLQGAYGFVF